MTDLPSLSTFFDRFSALVMALVASLRVRVREGAVPQSIGEEADRRVRRARTVVERLFGMLRDGTLGAWLARSAGRRGFRVAARVSVRPKVSMPLRTGWLCRYMPCTERYRDSAGYYQEMLARLLEEKAVQRMLAEHPRLGLAMRPLCRALGVDARLYLDVTAPEEAEVVAVEAPAPPVAAAAVVAVNGDDITLFVPYWQRLCPG